MLYLLFFSSVFGEFRYFNESCTPDSLEQESICIEDCYDKVASCIVGNFLNYFILKIIIGNNK